MQVVILCGGQGTRLREETEYRPKPMVPIGGRPILWHIMKTYAHHGHRDFILCLGYKGEVIKDYFRNYLWQTSDVTLKLGREPEVQYHTHHDEEDWAVTLLDTGPGTETGGRLARSLPQTSPRLRPPMSEEPSQKRPQHSVQTPGLKMDSPKIWCCSSAQ